MLISHGLHVSLHLRIYGISVRLQLPTSSLVERGDGYVGTNRAAH